MLSIRAKKDCAVLNLIKDCEGDKYFPNELIREAYDRDPTQNIYMYIYMNNNCVGFGMIRGWDECWDDKVLGIIISPANRGKGLGKLMMETLHTLASLRGLKRVRLHVAPYNKIAINMYRDMGYEYSGDREDGEWIMYKEI